MGCASTIVCVTKIVTTYAQVKLTETRDSARSRILRNFFSGIRLSMCNWNGDKEFYSLFCVTLVKRANSKKCGHDFEM